MITAGHTLGGIILIIIPLHKNKRSGVQISPCFLIAIHLLSFT